LKSVARRIVYVWVGSCPASVAVSFVILIHRKTYIYIELKRKKRPSPGLSYWSSLSSCVRSTNVGIAQSDAGVGRRWEGGIEVVAAARGAPRKAVGTSLVAVRGRKDATWAIVTTVTAPRSRLPWPPPVRRREA
jgi:hypothetical protein